jgi:hypothetical protein
MMRIALAVAVVFSLGIAAGAYAYLDTKTSEAVGRPAP